jgi:hypothetical protein
MRGSFAVALAALLIACGSESALVTGSRDSHEFARRARKAIPIGENDSTAEQTLMANGFACTRTDTLLSDEGDTLQSHPAAEDAGTEYVTCDYVRRRRWAEKTQRRFVVVLYVREHRIDRVFAVTHLREVQ